MLMKYEVKEHKRIKENNNDGSIEYRPVNKTTSKM